MTSDIYALINIIYKTFQQPTTSKLLQETTHMSEAWCRRFIDNAVYLHLIKQKPLAKPRTYLLTDRFQHNETIAHVLILTAIHNTKRHYKPWEQATKQTSDKEI